MRYFEILFLLLFVFSFLNLVILKNNKARIYLPVSAIVACLLSKIIEGFRSHCIPALILVALFLVYSLPGILRPAYNMKQPAKRGRSLHIMKVAALILLFPAVTISAGLPLLFPVAVMTKPDGPYQVGTQLLSFTDFSRTERLAPEVQNSNALNRRVPVQVWYPASITGEKKTARWIDSVEAINLFTKYRGLPDLFDQLVLVKTNSFPDAVLSNQEEKYPVVLFSCGSAMFTGQNVVQMEELASHGYVVFSVGHPYEDFACIFPDRTLTAYNPEHASDLSEDTANALKIARQTVADENDPEFHRTILRNASLNNISVKNWSADMRFVADKIVELNSGKIPGIFGGKLDVNRIGAFGHSFGGAACGQLCLEDDRIKAFVNMDGSPFGDAPDKEIQQPFMIMTHAGEEKYNIRNGYSAKEDNFLQVQIKGARHMNFSDFNTLTPLLGKLSGFLGHIDGNRQTEITNRYILDFFNKYLKEQPAPLLSSDSPVYKEVTVSIR